MSSKMYSSQKIPLMRGQALITLLFFTVIGVTVTGAAIMMILVNARSGQKQQQGEIAYQVAQSGAENGVLRLLRNPAYSGETVTVGEGEAAIAVTGNGTAASPFVLTSTGTTGNFSRVLQYTIEYENNLLIITDKREVY